jgi:CRISPR/Cas system-associated exonuclease Cas4 (RecB family)
VDYLRQRKWYGVQIRLPSSLDGVTVAAQPDLLFFRGKGQLTIVEWKTDMSETSNHRPQLLVYALAASRKWPEVKSEELEICEANLMKNEIRRHHITEQDLLEIEDFIFLSISEIKALTQGEGFSEQHLEDYEFANNPNTCQYCSFRQLCLEVVSEDASNQFIRDSEPVQLELPL